jgi:acyl-CoA thioesterase
LAALAVRTAVQGRPGLALRGVHASFARAAATGPIECTGRPVRAGKRSAIVRVELRQDERTVAVADAWLVPSEAVSGGPRGAEAAVAPTDRAEVAWIAEVLPGFAQLEERAIDFPASRDELACGPPSCDLWARARDPAWDPVEVDLLLLDAHLLDAALRSEGVDTVQATNLDLWATWLDRVPATAWRRVTTEAAIADAAAVATGRVTAEDGRLCAVAGSHARILRRG